MSIKYDVVDCWECPLNGGGNWNPGHCMVSARGKGGDDYRYVPGPVCPLVLLDAANAENEILCQRNLSDPLIQATTKHLQAEIEQLHESLAAKERECEELQLTNYTLRAATYRCSAGGFDDGELLNSPDLNACTRETPTPEAAQRLEGYRELAGRLAATEEALAAKERECEGLRGLCETLTISGCPRCGAEIGCNIDCELCLQYHELVLARAALAEGGGE